jgi:hypothetical protein
MRVSEAGVSITIPSAEVVPATHIDSRGGPSAGRDRLLGDAVCNNWQR